jgi:OOP family OmpA-OmpF porin
MTRGTSAALAAVLACASGCVGGARVRADVEVLQAEVDRARRAGAYRCAPRELAAADAHLDFAQGELSQGQSNRAAEHVHEATLAVRRALEQGQACPAEQEARPVVVRVEEVDGDSDGIPDVKDRCIEQPEDKDGFEDEDGCPDMDNDADGVLDAVDRCPLQAGAAENQGCPEERPKDRDADGIPDLLDRCLEQPEDRDGYQDEDGCPELDNDSDGLLDAADRCPEEAGPPTQLGCPVRDRDADGLDDPADACPDEPEDKDGHEDADGCPDLDNDTDGVPDASDACPMQAGPAEEKGCPRKYALVEVKQDRIEIKQQIRFATASARITGQDSFVVLGEVAQALRDNPQIKKLRVEGHTDSQGYDVVNLRLSQARADAVMAELIRLGVDPGRLQAVGYGESKPLAPNQTAAGRALNRRTEFNILEPSPAATPRGN